MSKHSSRGRKWAALRLAVLERDSWICTYCGAHLEDGHADPGRRPEVDHVVPVVQGGRDVADNLVAACKSCNGSKSDQSLVRITSYNPRWFPNGFAA